jgi:hypothetical protein
LSKITKEILSPFAQACQICESYISNNKATYVGKYEYSECLGGNEISGLYGLRYKVIQKNNLHKKPIFLDFLVNIKTRKVKKE